ncbi:MAG TPA: hypothetical protein VGD91_25535, partial [Trebonia sp.]
MNALPTDAPRRQGALPTGPAAPSDRGAAGPGPRRRRQLQPYVLLGPAVLVLVLVVGYPLVRLGIIS